MELARDSNKNADEITFGGAVPLLVSGLHTSSAVLQYHAEGAIWALARKNKKRKEAFVKAKAIPPLKTLSQSPNEQVKRGMSLLLSYFHFHFHLKKFSPLLTFWSVTHYEILSQVLFGLLRFWRNNQTFKLNIPYNKRFVSKKNNFYYSKIISNPTQTLTHLEAVLVCWCVGDIPHPFDGCVTEMRLHNYGELAMSLFSGPHDHNTWSHIITYNTHHTTL